MKENEKGNVFEFHCKENYHHKIPDKKQNLHSINIFETFYTNIFQFSFGNYYFIKMENFWYKDKENYNNTYWQLFKPSFKNILLHLHKFIQLMNLQNILLYNYIN